jgi:hypothetical protein
LHHGDVIDEMTPSLTVIDGRRTWLWPDGTLLPVVSGGSDDGNGGEGSGGAGEGTGAHAGQGEAPGAAGNTGDDGNGGEGQPEGDKKFTQAEVAEMVSRERAKARRAFEAESKQAAERAKMDEAERLKAEKADAEKAVEDARREVLTTRVETTAERLALKAKVDPDKVTRFLKIADLADLDTLTADGKPDETAIAKLVDGTLAEWPEFKANGNGRHGASGAEFNGNGKPDQLARADLKGMSPQEITKAKKEGRLRAVLGQN